MSNFLLATQVQAIQPTEASIRGRPSQKRHQHRPHEKSLQQRAGHEEGVFNVAYPKATSVSNRLQEKTHQEGQECVQAGVPVKADDSPHCNPVQEIRTGEPKPENSASFQLIVLSSCIWISSVFQQRGSPRTPTSAHSRCCCYNRPHVGALSRVTLGRFFGEDVPCFCFRLWVSWRTFSVHVIFFRRLHLKENKYKLAGDLKERVSRL